MDQSKDERDDLVIEYLKEGLTTREVAKKVGISNGWVSKIASSRGYDISTERTRKAAKCKSLYNRPERIKVIADGIDKLVAMLPEITKAKDMRDWSVSLAILMDKRRLEDSGDGNEKGGEFMALMKAMEEENGSATSER